MDPAALPKRSISVAQKLLSRMDTGRNESIAKGDAFSS